VKCADEVVIPRPFYLTELKNNQRLPAPPSEGELLHAKILKIECVQNKLRNNKAISLLMGCQQAGDFKTHKNKEM